MESQKIKPIEVVLDFDGTCVTHDFPKVGNQIGAVPVLKELVYKGHQLILFTMRSDVFNPYSENPEIITQAGDYLSQAVKWFADNEIPLYGIQVNPTQHTWTSSPKAYGQLMIDDSALGCPLKSDLSISHRPFVDWEKVRSLLSIQGVL
jgi:hypothetical protein